MADLVRLKLGEGVKDRNIQLEKVHSRGGIELWKLGSVCFLYSICCVIFPYGSVQDSSEVELVSDMVLQRYL